MDADLERKEANLRNLRAQLYGPTILTCADTLALYRAVDAEERELRGESLAGKVGFDHYLKGFILKHATWFNASDLEWASERRSSDRQGERE